MGPVQAAPRQPLLLADNPGRYSVKAVLREASQMLRPGGRGADSDIVLRRRLPEELSM